MSTVQSLFRSLNLSRALLVLVGLYLLGSASQNQILHGWFARGDLLPFLAGCFFLFSSLLPRVIRLNILIFVGLIILLEIPSRLVSSFHPAENVAVTDLEGNKQSLYTENRLEQFGYEMEANIKRVVKDTLDKKIIYESTVTTDSFGRRIIPGSNNKESDAFLAFFGDSFTFGDGVNDDETLPYFISKLLPKYLVYNYGVGGYGPQHTLAKIEGGNLHQEIGAKKGIGVYLYIDGHVGRAVYGMRSGWVQRSPYYELANDDSLIRKGNFHTSNPITYTLYQDLFMKSAFLSLLGFNPPYIGTKEILFTCRILNESKNRFAQQFPISNFIVIFHPGQNKYAQTLKNCFNEKGINYLDYSEMPWPEQYRIPFDGHPNARGHQYFAELIAPQLREAIKQLLAKKY